MCANNLALALSNNLNIFRYEELCPDSPQSLILVFSRAWRYREAVRQATRYFNVRDPHVEVK